MKILLVGKFPPCQGGVASKFYWLFSSLLARDNGFQFRAITIAKQPYTTSLPSNVASMVKVIDAENKTLPWFIPKSDLFVDQIVSCALQLANTIKFDLIICNYLEPYLAATYIIAKELSLPYQVYPAGSDTHKLLPCPLTSYALEAYLKNAAQVFLPKEKIASFLKTNCSVLPNRVVEAQRYVPDPSVFSVSTVRKINRILLLGKINRYWKLRGIRKLCQFLDANPEIKLKCIIQGAYCDEFKKELRSQLPCAQLEFQESFLSPTLIPKEISSSIGVWNYLSEGGIVDFPNLHWETIFSGRLSFCSNFLLEQPDSSKTLAPFHHLIVNADTSIWPVKTMPNYNSSNLEGNLKVLKHNMFEQYIGQHYRMFEGGIGEY